MFLVGAASNFERIPLPFDCRSVVCSLGFASFTLDVVLMVAGVFLIVMAWVFTRLAQ
jgi:hypothetical protein